MHFSLSVHSTSFLIMVIRKRGRRIAAFAGPTREDILRLMKGMGYDPQEISTAHEATPRHLEMIAKYQARSFAGFIIAMMKSGKCSEESYYIGELYKRAG